MMVQNAFKGTGPWLRFSRSAHDLLFLLKSFSSAVLAYVHYLIGILMHMNHISDYHFLECVLIGLHTDI